MYSKKLFLHSNINKLLSVFLAIIIVLVATACTSRGNSDADEDQRSDVEFGTYNLDFYLESENKLACSQNTTYINTTDKELDTLYFHAYLNAFKSEDTLPTEVKTDPKSWFIEDFSPGNMDIKRATGESVSKFNLTNNDQIVEVVLSKPLAPGKSTGIFFEYSVTLPHATTSGHPGIHDGFYEVSYCYLIACKYDEQGWAKDSYPVQGDAIYSDVANYEVVVSLPKRMILASSGEQREKNTNNGITTYKISAPSIREFALFFSDNFKVTQEKADGTRILVYSTKNEGKKAAKSAANSLKYFNKTFGKYDYPTLSIVLSDVSGGMEHPGIITAADGRNEPSAKERDLLGINYSESETSIVHEVAHQWWFAMVGSNQNRYAWLDEGLATYSSYLYLREKYGEEKYEKEYSRHITGYTDAYNAKKDPSMDKPTSEFQGDDFGNLVYGKTIIMYHALRSEIGDQLFFASLKRYFAANKYKNTTPNDLIEAFDTITGKTWQQWFDDWLNGKSPQPI